MFSHILIPTDGSDLSHKAVLYGVQLAKLTGGKVTALSVRAPYALNSMDVVSVVGSQDQYDAEADQAAGRALSQAEVAAQTAGVTIQTMQVTHDQPFHAIIDAAKAGGCDLIVMASHGRRGVSALLLGSETNKVLTHTTIPVLVYR